MVDWALVSPTSDATAGLFSPFSCRGMSLANRVVMAPMTRERAPGGVPTRAMADYYRRRAAGGTGLIITEGAAPNPAGHFGSAVPRCYGEDALEGWRQVVEAVHAEGAAILVQLWHVGAFEPSLVGMQDSLLPAPVRLSPSGLAAPGRPLGRAMSHEEIVATIEDFATACCGAMEAGFDGVEIHGAHGYLPDQFLWSGTNLRDDAWGGELAGRMRFVRALVQACRSALGPRKVLSYRYSQWKQLDYAARIADTPDELAFFLAALRESGVDLLHCSTRRYWEPAFPGSDRCLADWSRELGRLPVIAVGSVTLGTDLKSPGGREHAEALPDQVEDVGRRIAVGEFDLIALGRALLANPDWARKVQNGQLDQLADFDRTQLDVLD